MFAPLDSTTIYSKSSHQLLYTPDRWNQNALGYTFALRIPFHLLHCRCNTCTNTINNDMIHFISSCDHIGSSIHRRQVLLKLHYLTRSLTSMPLTCPSHLQPVHRAKSCLDLLHLDHMTQCHVSCVMSSFIITCVSFAITPSHFHRHGICFLHTYTCGLITCASHINTISPPKVITQLSKPNRTFQSPPFW
jgi:hypothetical protein